MLLDSRLLRQGRYGSLLLGVSCIAAFAGGVLALLQAQLFSRIIDEVFLRHQSHAAIGGLFLGLAVVLSARALLLGAQDVAASRAAFKIKQALREHLIEHFTQIQPFGLEARSSGEINQVVIEGVDALEPYFAQYLPQAFVAVSVPPLLCVAAFLIDPLSGFVFLVTAPLIPLFMRLIADISERQTKRQWGRLGLLSAFLFDALQGLTTIKRSGKSEEIARQLAYKGDEYRRATLETLRTTFLSALVMELLTTLSTAVVAVQVGLRLLYGWISFEEALFVLVIAPEFYLPLRLLGQRFHAGMSGLTAWRRIEELFTVVAGHKRSPSTKRSVRNIGERSATHEAECEVALRGVSYAYPGRGEILSDLWAELRRGQITVLIGESGSGKTTLLNLLLRLAQPSQGEIWADGRSVEDIPLSEWWQRIAYASQTPFLFQGTIGENIALAKPKASFAEVQRAAKMAYADEFIARLPGGYDAQLGEGGYGLSAGEKQRLVLARAYLKDAPILILDEITANVDPRSLEKILFSLRQYSGGKTVLIVSHQPQVWEIGDRFWLLENGRIETLEREEFESRLSRARRMSPGESRSWVSQSSYAIQFRVQGGATFSSQARIFDLPDASGAPALKPIDLWKPWLSQVWALRSWVLLAVLLGWVSIFSNIGLLAASAYLISFAALQPSIALLQTTIVGVRFFGISRSVFRYLERLSSHRVTLDLLSKLRVWVYRSLEPKVPGIFGRYGSGELLSRLIGDIASLEPFYVRAVAPLLVALLVATGVVIWLFLNHPTLALTALGLSLLVGFVFLPAFYRMTELVGAPNNALRGEFSERLAVFMQSLSELKVNQRLSEFQRRLSLSAYRHGNGVFKLSALLGLQGAWMSLVAYWAMWFTLWVATPLVGANLISGLALAGLGLGVWASFEGFLLLPQAIQHFATGRQALFRLAEIASQTKGVTSSPSGSLRRISRFEIKVVGVHFSYHALGDKPETMVSEDEARFDIKELSFSIREGERVGIVGPSGSGKSTVIGLLLGMFEPQRGEIILDGRDLRNYDLAWWRALVASCGQGDYLFNASLRSNLVFLNEEASEEEIWRALEAVKLADFVRSLPEGLETLVGEHGKQLSGGERQRVLLARTLLRVAPLYIFDEPTANLDLPTAVEVIQNILSWTSHRALVIVSHQAIGFERMDKILVFEKGRISQQGSHAELIESSGYYSQLWRRSNLA
ncbi:MAG: thiol reductant ABC exporter subunit CydD [Anaerolineales bacterium]|nr:thiol reductant ABC exporter subunit CydD [Anaerolineales bacterium]MDW8447489.1 thiol reductant ABC exporter subunit CydD [Anaerolineales bacterium]